MRETLALRLTNDIEGTASKVGISVNKQIEDSTHAFTTVVDEKLMDHKKDYAASMKELRKRSMPSLTCKKRLWI